MPLVNITLIEGRSVEARRALIREVTNAVERSISAPRESIRVILHEVPASNWGVAGETKDASVAKSQPPTEEGAK